jgi:hypothetical protein
MTVSRLVIRALPAVGLALLLWCSRADTSGKAGQLNAMGLPGNGITVGLGAIPLARADEAPRGDRAGRHEAEENQKRRVDCQQKLALELASETLPGAPGLEAARGRVLLYAKAEPTQFVRKPELDQSVTKSARSYRSMLQRTSSPWSMLHKLLPVFAANQELARAVLLREGYLYADKPELAFALVDLISAQLLFNEKDIWIHRGERVLRASRTRGGNYAFTDGPEKGKRVRLLLFDRIGTGDVPTALHRDFRGLRQRLGFDRAKVVHQTTVGTVADLRYGSVWVRSLLRAEGARFELDCEAPNPEAAPIVAEHRAEQARKARVLEPLRRAMVASVEDGLPFDEPRTEYGQQDGQLRNVWRRAYEAGRHTFEFQDDQYNVFNLRGAPLVPEVCVDFLFDTYSRAGGTWWRERGQKREVVYGKWDFAKETELDLRKATSIVDLAQSRPDWLELHQLPERERIPFKYNQQLVDYLIGHADEYLPGDIVLIRGYAPWDKPWKPKIMHFHSFFVYESDPLTGMPMTLAGNPGNPLLQTWQFEAFRTPERSIWYRLRPKISWLERVVKVDEKPATNAPPLSVDPTTG